MKKAVDCRNFVIAGHSGSGKTSLSDLMLYKAKAVDRLGSVDQKTSISDFSPDEQEKRSSIYSSVLNCIWKDKHFFFTDTPGYAEFVGDTASSMRAADGALVVLDGVEGPQVGTARAWKFARQRDIPRFGFINRLDRERSDFRATLEKMRANHGKNVVIPITWPVGKEADLKGVINVLFEKNVPAEIADDVAECRGLWMDAIAETDEELMMRYLDGATLTDDEIRRGLAAAILSKKVIPVLGGSAVKDIGVTELMDFIADYFPSPLARTVIFADKSEQNVSDDGPAIGLVFKNINDPFLGQLTFIRVRSGVFKPDTEVNNLNRGVKERFGQLLLVNGKIQTPADAAGPGTIFAVTKLKDTHFGDTLSTSPTAKELPPIDYPHPVMSYSLAAAKSGEDDKMLTALHKMSECDPTLKVGRQDETHELLLSGMGDQHLAIALRRLKDVYKVDALLAAPKIPYRETITAPAEAAYRHKKQSGGSGQFAEVHLRICPNEAGYEFSNDVVGGAIPRNFIPAVEKGVQETMLRGPLVGCHVERIKVSVFDGKDHPVDSNEMAFKIASRTAFKEAISKARPVLLEPIMAVRIQVPEAYMGDITGDINHKRGRILGMDTDEGLQVVNAEVPLAEMQKYATELRSMTQGRGSFEMDFARYEQVPPSVAGPIISKYQASQAEDKE